MEDVLEGLGIVGSDDSKVLMGRGCYPMANKGGECPGHAKSLCCDRNYPVRNYYSHHRELH
jgi:hypothetical protein